MRKPTMTLQDVQRILDDQNRHLQAAYRALIDESAGRPIAPPVRALDQLRDVCDARTMPSTPPGPANGIRC
jgi:hypothetical protein